MVIYVEELLTQYVLPLDGPDRHWKPQPDPAPEIRRKYFDDEEVRKLLHLPPSCLPPIGGTARFWEKDPGQWRWVGCRMWHRLYQRSQFQGQFPGRPFRPVVFQIFQNGKLIGRLRSNTQTEQAEVICIMDGGNWFPVELADKPASSVDATATKPSRGGRGENGSACAISSSSSSTRHPCQVSASGGRRRLASVLSLWASSTDRRASSRCGSRQSSA